MGASAWLDPKRSRAHESRTWLCSCTWYDSKEPNWKHHHHQTEIILKLNHRHQLFWKVLFFYGRLGLDVCPISSCSTFPWTLPTQAPDKAISCHPSQTLPKSSCPCPHTFSPIYPRCCCSILIHGLYHQTTSQGTLSKAFSKSTKAIQRSFFLAKYFSCDKISMVRWVWN